MIRYNLSTKNAHLNLKYIRNIYVKAPKKTIILWIFSYIVWKWKNIAGNVPFEPCWASCLLSPSKMGRRKFCYLVPQHQTTKQMWRENSGAKKIAALWEESRNYLHNGSFSWLFLFLQSATTFLWSRDKHKWCGKVGNSLFYDVFSETLPNNLLGISTVLTIYLRSIGFHSFWYSLFHSSKK